MDIQLGCILGNRIDYCGSYGTVRYIGNIFNREGVWLGIEWDDLTRGKHSGTFEGKTYFVTHNESSGSFVKPSKVNYGIDFLFALESKYGDENNDVELIANSSNDSKLTFECRGFEKLLVRVSNFKFLNKLCLSHYSIKSCENVEKISEMFPNLTELDIGYNLFKSWDDFAYLCSTLSTLTQLDISGNRLKYCEELNQICTRFHHLKVLVMNKMLINWQFIIHHGSLFASIENLYLHYNNISTLQSIDLPNLVLIDLSGNPIESWDNVHVLGELSNLQTLILSDCKISSIFFKSGLSDSGQPFFSKLNSLTLTRNNISDWSSINELNKLQFLTNLIMYSNPLTQSKNEIEEGKIRSEVTSRIGSLQLFNKSAIFLRERTGDEWRYLRIYGKEWKKCSDSSDEKALADFHINHPRYEDLITKHGAPDEHELNAVPATLKDKIIEINLCLNHDSSNVVKKKIPRSISIQNLKRLILKLFKLKGDISDIDLSYTSQDHCGAKFAIDNNSSVIDNYPIGNNDWLYIVKNL